MVCFKSALALLLEFAPICILFARLSAPSCITHVLGVWISPRVLLSHQHVLRGHYIQACAPGPSHLMESSCSLCLPPPSPSSTLLLLRGICDPQAWWLKLPLLFSPATSCSHIYLPNIFKLESKAYTASFGALENLLLREQPGLGG